MPAEPAEKIPEEAPAEPAEETPEEAPAEPAEETPEEAPAETLEETVEMPVYDAAAETGKKVTIPVGSLNGYSASGNITEKNLLDTYTFTMPTSGTLTVETSSEIDGIRYYLYNATNLNRAINEMKVRTTGGLGRAVATFTYHLTAGTYIWTARHNSDYAGTRLYGAYSLKFGFVSANETFPEKQGGSDNTFATANALDLSSAKQVVGQIGWNDGVDPRYGTDFYRITLAKASKLTLTTTADFPITYRLFDRTEDNAKIWEDSVSTNSAGQANENYVVDLTAGTYYLRVQGGYERYGTYSFTASAVSAGENFPEKQGGSDNTVQSANPVSLGTMYAGQIALNDEFDYYRFTLPAKRVLYLDAASKSDQTCYYLFDSTGKQIWSKKDCDYDSGKNQSTVQEYISETKLTEGGTFYLAVGRCTFNKYYTGNYTFTLKEQVAQPDGIQTAIDANGVKVSWNKVDGAPKYRVFYKKYGENSWHKAGDTTDTSYVVTKTLVSDTWYYFTVRCLDNSGNYYSSFNNDGVRWTYYGKPAVQSVTNAEGGVTVKWKKVPGAGRYTVFVKGGKYKSWTQLGTTYDTVLTPSDYFANRTLQSNVQYSFTVRCGTSGNYISAYDTKGKSITYYAPPTLKKVEGSSSGAKITWGKVAGVSKYCVFGKESGAKSWKKLGTTTSTSYTYKKAKAGVTYVYTVRCMDGKDYISGYDSKGIELTCSATPKVKAVENVQGGLRISWDSATGARKYRVYYKTSAKSGWKKLGDTYYTSFTWEDGKVGKKYWFTVRSIDYDGKYYTSSYNTTGKTGTFYKLANPSVWTSSGTNGITISWSRPSGSERYRIYYRVGQKGAWKKLKDVNYTGSYLWKGGTKGTSYSFTVRCLSANGKSYISNYNTVGTTATRR